MVESNEDTENCFPSNVVGVGMFSEHLSFSHTVPHLPHT